MVVPLNVSFKDAALGKTLLHDVNHYGGLSPLTLKFSDDCFSRIFSELKRSGLPTILEESQAEELHELEKAVKSMSLDEDALVLTAHDTVAVDSFDAAATAAVPARAGRRARQAVPARDGPDELRFLHFAGISRLVDLKGQSLAPFEVVARLAGALGECFSHQSRVDVSSTAYTAGCALRAYMVQRLGGPADHQADGLLAINLKSTLLSLQLPELIRAGVAFGSSLHEEFLFSIAYARDGGPEIVLASTLQQLRKR